MEWFIYDGDLRHERVKQQAFTQYSIAFDMSKNTPRVFKEGQESKLSKMPFVIASKREKALQFETTCLSLFYELEQCLLFSNHW